MVMDPALSSLEATLGAIHHRTAVTWVTFRGLRVGKVIDIIRRLCITEYIGYIGNITINFGI